MDVVEIEALVLTFRSVLGDKSVTRAVAEEQAAGLVGLRVLFVRICIR